ncbi:MAG: regulatory protein GemA [Pseudomonadota bacterium]
MTAVATKPKSKRDPFIVSCQVAKKKLGMEDEAYRAMLYRVAGVRSSTLVPHSKRKEVLEELDRLGADTGGNRGPQDRMDGPYAAKLQALWIAGWNLGVVKDRSDKACMNFVRRMTKISHTRFLHQADDGTKAIETLKQWLARDGMVSWQRNNHSQLPYINDPQFRIVQAQYRALMRARVIDRDGPDGPISQIEFLKDRCRHYGMKRDSLVNFEKQDWIDLMNELGAEVRAARGR